MNMRKFFTELPHFSIASMPKSLLRISILIAVTFALHSLVFSQAKWRMPITLTDSTAPLLPNITSYFGVHPNATSCIDIDTMKGFNDHWAEQFVFLAAYTPDCIEYDAPPLGFDVELRLAS